jgi:serine/threonine protein kinase/tetratricopeptide (TPR) repeat protein
MNKPPNREVVIFNAALELPAGQRGAYLQEACADDPALRLRLEALLRVHEAAGGFLETPPPGAEGSPIAAEVAGAALGHLAAPSEKAGDRIGRYKLLQQIGEGGCGVVYMAEQEEPVRRRVALKVIKLGMDTRRVIARFEAERQALALMDHPNIAKVLEAGATGTGRPYFVMELVHGIKITDYCDQNHLSTRVRLDLFVQVCQAIQHAHQKGIIHRDVKPSNILVTSRDGVPVPKVIDFGIAKATTGQPLTDKTLFTAFEQFIGTPAYMSPEQAEMSELGIDTRSDIYSLGVLLYELLTGRTPFEAKRLLEAGLDEVRRIIREEEPVRPSTRFHTLAAADQTTVAKHRQSDPPKLAHLIRGDLDWIVMKALEKDRARRYETANGLARDIERHLNNEPVVARPPSRLYEFQKTVRRHKLGFAAAGAVVTALVIGLGLSTWLFVKEKAARQRAVAAEKTQSQLREQAQAGEKKAETEAAKSRQVAQFLKDMLAGVGPSRALGRDTKMLREILDKTVERVGKDLATQPEVEAELRSTIGNTYFELGDYPKAEAMHRVALRLRRALFGQTNESVAASLNSLGCALDYQDRRPEAERSLRQALEMRRQLLGNEHLDVATSLHDLARPIGAKGREPEAEAMYREALAIRRKLLGNRSPEVAQTLAQFCTVLARLGKWGEAEAMAREALTLSRAVYGDEHPEVGRALNNLAGILGGEGKLDEAEKLYRQGLAMRRKLLGNEHALVALTLAGLARVLQYEGKLSEAEASGREVVNLYKKLPDIDSTPVVWSLTDLVTVLLRERKFDEAERLFNDVLTPAFQSQPQSAGPLSARGNLRARMGRWKEAAADFSKVVEFEPGNHEACHYLAPLLVQSGDLEGYRRHCARVVARFGGTNDPVIAERMAKDCLLLPKPGADLATESNWADTAVTVGTNHQYLAFFQFAKGLAEYRQGHFAGAIQWTEKVLAKTGRVPFRDVQACMVLAMAQYRSKQIDRARATFAKGVEIAETKLPRLDSGDLGYDWLDWIVAHALLREAKALIISAD